LNKRNEEREREREESTRKRWWNSLAAAIFSI
jgi:hypothetical protein